MAELCTLLVGYPLWAAEPVLEQVKDTIKFPATRAEFKPLLEEKVRLTKYAEYWEEKALAQVAARDQFLLEGPDRSLERKELADSWLDRSDPKAQKLATKVNEEARRLANLAKLESANRALFLKECRAAGIDPERGVSPTLLKVLGEHGRESQ